MAKKSVKKQAKVKSPKVQTRKEKFTIKAIELRERFSSRLFIYSIITFAISLLIYFITNEEVLMAFFGFIAIISGAIAVLFLIIFLIFFFLEKMSLVPKRKKAKKRK
ncbi:hypothetical protein GW932_00380 [archaeon]|nr:hypothetical protein [archaeon]